MLIELTELKVSIVFYTSIIAIIIIFTIITVITYVMNNVIIMAKENDNISGTTLINIMEFNTDNDFHIKG